MRNLIVLLLFVAVSFGVYAYLAHYKNTDPSQPVPVRIKAALAAAWMATGGALVAFVQQWTGP